MSTFRRSVSLPLTVSLLLALSIWVASSVVADGGLRVRAEALAGATGASDAVARYLEERSHVAVVEVDGAYDRQVDGELNLLPRALVARELYGHHPDSYDFLIAFSSFEFDTGDAVAFHVGVRNDVQGIGLPLFDDSAVFGSDGRLRGYVDMGALGRYVTDPLDPGFERSLSILAHEILHQWGAYVRFRRPDGTLSDALLGRDGSHWSYLLDSDGSVLYGNDWQETGDGTYTSRAVETFFSPLDLYLAGFFGPDEVPPFLLIDNPAIDPTRLPRRGAEVAGEPLLVTIDDVIAAEGPRVPAADEAPKEFRAAFVFLVRPGEQPTERQIQTLERLRAGLLDRFGALTGGRAILEVFPEALPAGEPGAPGEVPGGPVRDTEASLGDGLAWLRSSQRQEGYWEDRPGTRLRDTVTALSTLGTLDPSFTREGAALDWLAAEREATTDFVARKLGALAAQALDSSAERGILLDLENPDGGWGLGRGYASDAMDTALAVAALAGAGDQAAGSGADLLVAMQNADGGWSVTAGGPSRTGVTAAVLRALDAVDRIDQVAAGAAAFLASRQNPDGGFGDSPSTVHDTANALQGLIAAGALGAADAPAALTYLSARQSVDGSWAGSVYATALAVDTLKRGRFPNWRFTAPSTAEPAAPRDGERVRLTFTVANDGSLETPAGVLRLYEGDPGDPEGGGTPSGADLEIPPLAPGGAVTLSRFWDSLDRPGANRLVALLDPDGALEELSELDNRAELTVDVAPAPEGAELEITAEDLTVSPPRPTELPADLALSATVRNLGKTDVGAVVVELVAGPAGSGPDAGQVMDQQTVAIPQRTATPVHFAYTLTAPGTTVLTVRVDPADEVAEADESNNSASTNVTTEAAVDLAVAPADLSVDGTPTLGSDVTLRALLHNRGTVDAPEAAVRFTVTDGATTRDLEVAPVLLPAGGSAERSALWRVDLTGDLVFSVSIDEADAVAETDETNNRASLDLSAGTVTEPNLTVAYQDLTFTPDPGLEGSPVELAALVRNTGGAAAGDIEVGFYEGDPDQGGRLQGELQRISSLAAGDGATVSISLPTVEGAGDRLIVVVADPADRLAELTEEDNRAFRTLEVLSLPDLAVSPSAVESVPALPEPGAAVTTTVTVANHGEQEARNVTVRLTGDGVPLGPDQTLAVVAAGTSGAVSFTWSFPEGSGAVLLSATVDPEGAVAEGSEANNRADREIAAFDAGRAVSNPYFSPNGDGVRDTTVYGFTLAAPTTVTVQVLDTRNRAVRSEAGPAFQSVVRGRFEWDGRDDAGQVVADGGYLFAVVDGSGQRLDDAPVVVDTDRWPLFEALGTPFERISNLTCNLPGVSQLGVVETGDLAYFRVSAGSGFDSSTDGVYRVPTTGGRFERIVDKLRPGSMVFSSDGEKVVVDDTIWSAGALQPLGFDRALQRKFLPSTQDLLWVQSSYYSTPYQLRLTPLDGSGPERLLAEFSSRPRFGLYDEDDVSPDGRTLLLGCGPSGSFLDVETGRISPMRMPEGRGCYFRQEDWSPDGSRYAVTSPPVWNPEIGWQESIIVFDRDGSLVRVIDAPLDPFGTISAYPGSEGIPTDVDSWDVDLSRPTWGESGEELAYTVQYRENGFGPGGSHYGVHYGRVIRSNVVTGAQKTVAWIEPQIFIYSYPVETWDGSRWVERGQLHYGLHYSANRLDLSDYLPDADGEYKVRIRQQGREAAHVDQVALELETEEGLVELRPAAAHLGSGQDVTGLVRVLDRDVVDLHERSVVVRWGAPEHAPSRVVLTLVAREEDLSTRQARPFRYPSASGSYHYLVGSRPGMEVDGVQTGADALGEPLFSEWSVPDTGHPAATVYGYVGNDGESLYAALDFTVDNTEDGDRDWAALLVETAEGWREFRVTAADRRWGEVAMTRTGRVHHRHKYYEFRVPFSELGLRAGETAAVRFAAYGTAAELEGAGTFLPQDGWYPEWVPGADRILYYPDRSDSVWLVDATGETPPRRILEEFGTFTEARFGGAGRTLLFEDGRDTLDPQGECYDPEVGRSTFALTSLANDGVALDAGPTPDGRGIAFSGTATDLHFSRWLLEYASEEIPDFWTPVLPPVETPAVDEELAIWIPPGPGAYLVRLTVEDLAGNRRRVVRRFASPSATTVSITDLSVAPRYISPDGDDVQDTATVRYRVLAPVHLEIAVVDELGERVRTFVRDHSVVGSEHQVIWDGRDDSGLPVPDGRYRIEVQGYGLTVTVDTTAPEVQGFELDGPGIVRNTLERGAVLDLGPRAVWCVHDEHPAGGELQTGQGSAPTVWKTLGSATVGTSCPLDPGEWQARDLTVAQLTGTSFRLEARDLAGNVTRRTVGPAAEQLALYRFRVHPAGSSGEMLFPEHAVPADGGVLLEGAPPVRMRVAESSASELARIVVQIQRVDAACPLPPCVGEWQELDVASVHAAGSTVPEVLVPDGVLDLVWDSSLLDPAASYRLRLRARTVDGEDLFSNVLTLRFATDGIRYLGALRTDTEPPTDDPAATRSQLDLALGRAGLRPSETTVLWAVETIDDTLTDVGLVVTSEDDPRYAGGQVLPLGGEAGGVLVFDGADFLPCKSYSGRVVARALPAGGGDARPVESSPVETPLPCLVLEARLDAPLLAGCGEAPDSRRRVTLVPRSLDGVPLQLLSVAVDDPENVVESVNRPLPDVETTFDLDTGALAEGIHTLLASLTNGEGDASVRRLSLAIDRSPPRVEITYPADGQRLCGMPDGSGRRVVTLEGTVNDFGVPGEVPARFETERPDGSWDGVGQLSPPTAALPSPGPFEGLESLSAPVSYDLADVAGSVRVRLAAADAGGHRVCSAPIDFFFDGAVEGFSASVGPTLVSPDGDGVADRVQISFVGAEATAVDVTVYPGQESELFGVVSVEPAGPAVRTLAAGLATAGAGSVVWDGASDGGAPVPDGLYAVVVQATDGCGNTARSVRGVRVDTRPPEVQILSPTSGDGLPLVVEVIGTATDPNFATFTLEHGVGAAPFTWSLLAGGEQPVTGDRLGPWNTFGLAGEQTLRVTATDLAGNSAATVVTLTLPPSDSLVTALEVVPEAFSPNGDGALDAAAVRFGFAREVQAELQVVAADGTPVRTLATGETFPSGSALRSWDGRDDTGQVVPDGRYGLRLRATAAADSSLGQDEQVPVVVDTAAPLVELTRPRDGFAPGTAAVTGRLLDPRLDSWVVELTDTPDLPDWRVIGEGDARGLAQSAESELGVWEGLAEGPHALRVRASDRAGNRVERLVPFEVDDTAPEVELAAPAAGTVLGAALGPVSIQGSAAEEHPRCWRLELGAGGVGEEPASWTQLADGDGLPPVGALFDWLGDPVPDGLYTLRLVVEDLGGLTGEARAPIVVDNSPPAAAITTPAADAWVTGPVTVTGTAWDPNLVQLRLEVAPAGTASWSELGRSTAAVQSGPLFAWQALPPDGAYRLRLVVEDRAANRAVAEIPVRVDTRPPVAPEGLVVRLADDGGSVTLTWQANGEVDLAGYFVERDGVRLSPTPVGAGNQAPTYLDPLDGDGTFHYAVRAVDRAGLESAPSAVAEVVRDTTPPGVVLHRPQSGDRVSGLVDVRITAASSDFAEYRLWAGPADGSLPLELLRRSPTPARSEVVAQWNAAALPQGGSYRFRLEGEDVRGNVGVAEAVVEIDTLPPAAPTGLTATVAGADVALAWNANGEADLAGYLVYRDGTLIHGTGDDFVLRALPEPAYTDTGLPDGAFSYRVIAIDRAGNLSQASAPAEAAIDQRTPHAEIVRPAPGTRFDTPVYVLASLDDRDVAEVRFERRPVGGAWSEITLLTAAPWETTWDPSGLDYGDYELRAVATDGGGQTDPAPTAVPVTYTDLGRPAPVAGLAVRVDGGSVHLSWSPGSEPDLAGYLIDRVPENGSPVRITASPVAGTSFVDSGVPDDRYVYSVVAVDVYDNESLTGATAEALVYTPALDQPWSPTARRTVALAGQVRPLASVAVEIVRPAGTESLPPVVADAEGRFRLEGLALGVGVNELAAVATDAAGNRSKRAAVEVLVGEPPSAPTGLAATVVDRTINLAWTPNPEPGILGYRVFLDGVPRHPDTWRTGVSATASSYSGYSYPSRAVDSRDYTYWSPASDQPLEGQWLAASWADPAVVTRLVVRWYDASYSAADYDLEALGGDGSWRTLLAVRANAEQVTGFDLPEPYVTTAVRIVLHGDEGATAATVPVRLAELSARHRPVTASASESVYTGDALHELAVTAVDQHGFESAPSTPLEVGVGDVEAPPPVALTATLDGADAVLAWTESAATDLLFYGIYRDGEQIGYGFDPVDRSYRDPALANGTYRYTVRAFDQVGNASDPSNEVELTVALPVPGAPGALTVSDPGTGDALDLSWSPPGDGAAVTRYAVTRAPASGGPYASVGETAETSYRDRGLDEGTTYYYVVRAVDALGNAGDPSNEASGVPVDRTGPRTALHHPATAGVPYRTSTPLLPLLVGTSEPGSPVTVLRDGAPVGEATAGASSFVDRVPYDAYGFLHLAPDGRSAVVDDGWTHDLVDFTTGTGRPLNGLDNTTAFWFRDGEHLLVSRYDGATGKTVLGSYGVGDGVFHDLVNVGSLDGALPSPDGHRAAVVGRHDQFEGLFLIDLTSGETTDLVADATGTFDVEDLSWSPDGSRIAYAHRISYDWQVEVADVASGAVTVIDDAPRNSWNPAWSPSGEELVYVASDSGWYQLWRYPLDTGVAEPLTTDEVDHLLPQWSPDGTRVAYLRDWVAIDVLDLETGRVTVLEVLTNWWNSLVWNGSGRLATLDDGQPVRITPPGLFELGGVPLLLGDNSFTAQAVDAAGNVGEPSEPAVVTLVADGGPNLAVAAAELAVLPAVPLSGQTVTLSATVRSTGVAEAPPSSVSLVLVEPGGTTRPVAEVVLDALAPGTSRTVTETATLGTTPGRWRLIATADPLNRVFEADEDDNRAELSFLVPADGTPVVAVEADPAEVGPNEELAIKVELVNAGADFSGRLEVSIEDGAGYLVEGLPPVAVPDLASGSRRLHDLSWNAGEVFAGEYRVVARLVDDAGAPVGEASSPFVVTAAARLSASVVTERALYEVGETVRLVGTALYQEGNGPLTGSSTRLMVLDAEGGVVAEWLAPLGELLPGAEATVSADWESTGASSGSYRARFEVLRGGAPAAAAESPFELVAPNLGLIGTLALSDSAPPVGAPVTATFRVTNGTPDTLTALPLEVAVTRPADGVTVLSDGLTLDLAPGEAAESEVILETAALGLDEYLVLLRAGSAGPVTLAAVALTPVDGTPPEIRSLEPADGSELAATTTTVRVVTFDTLSGVDRVEVALDGGPWLAATFASPADGLWTRELTGLDGGDHALEVRAVDGAGNEAYRTVAFTVSAGEPELVATQTATLALDADGDGLPSPGDEIAYEVIVSNTGGAEATGVLLTEPVPTHTALVAGSVETTVGAASATEPALEVDLGPLGAGESATVRFRVTVELPVPAGVDRVEAQGVVTSAELPALFTDDPALGGDADPTVTMITAAPELVVEKSAALAVDPDGDGLPSPGDTLEYRVTVRNTGNTSATAVGLADPVPLHTSLVAGSARVDDGSGPSSVTEGDPLLVDLGEVPGRSSVDVTFRVVIDLPIAAGVREVTNQGLVVSTELADVVTDDPAVDGAADPTVTPVSAAPVLLVEKTDALFQDLDGDGLASPGDELLYRITVGNTGNTAATALTLVDPVPENTVLVADTVQVAGGTLVLEEPITVTTDLLPVGDELVVSFRVRIDEPFPLDVQAIANGAEVTGAEPDLVDPVPSDDPDTLAPGDPTVTEVFITPEITASDVTLEEHQGSAVFRFALSEPSNRPVTVEWTTRDAGATAGIDYLAGAGRLVFAPGETEATVAVEVIDDALDELDEGIALVLSEPVGGTLADPEARATIVDDDPPPFVTVADVEVVEGDGPGAEAVFQVSLSDPSGLGVQVSYATADTTAEAGSDYQATAGTVVIPAGLTGALVRVPILGDLVDERDETFGLTLTGVVNAVDPADPTGGGTAARATILDDDTARISVDDLRVDEGDDGTADALFPVRLTTAADREITVSYVAVEDEAGASSHPATPDEDFTPVTGTVAFAAGSTEAVVAVPIVGDLLLEADEETFSVHLFDPTETEIEDGVATGTIVDDELCPGPNLLANPGAEARLVTTETGDELLGWTEVEGAEWTRRLAPPEPFEGEASFGAGTVQIGELAQDVEVAAYEVRIDGAGGQRFAFSGRVCTFDEVPPDTARIVVEYRDRTDTMVLDAFDSGEIASPFEWREVADVRVVPVGTGWVRVRLIADRFTEGSTDAYFDALSLRSLRAPVLTVSDATVVEGDGEPVDARFRIALSCPFDRDVTARYATADQSALAGLDYTPVQGLVDLPSGATRAEVAVPVLGDEVHELHETFLLELAGSEPANELVTLDRVGVGLILNDDFCARSHGFWKTHGELWPTDWLLIGGIEYGVADLQAFLDAKGGDATLHLTRELVAAKLNLLVGSDPGIVPAVEDADAYLVLFPPGSDPKGADRQLADALKDALEAYNNPRCEETPVIP